MVYIEDMVTNANATQGSNIASGKWYQIIDKNRVLRKTGLIGGTAASTGTEPVVEVFFGAKKVGEIRGRASGTATTGCVPPADTDMHWYMGNEVLPKGQPLNLIIKVVPTTNALCVALDMPEID